MSAVTASAIETLLSMRDVINRAVAHVRVSAGDAIERTAGWVRGDQDCVAAVICAGQSWSVSRRRRRRGRSGWRVVEHRPQWRYEAHVKVRGERLTIHAEQDPPPRGAILAAFGLSWEPVNSECQNPSGRSLSGRVARRRHPA